MAELNFTARYNKWRLANPRGTLEQFKAIDAKTNTVITASAPVVIPAKPVANTGSGVIGGTAQDPGGSKRSLPTPTPTPYVAPGPNSQGVGGTDIWYKAQSLAYADFAKLFPGVPIGAYTALKTANFTGSDSQVVNQINDLLGKSYSDTSSGNTGSGNTQNNATQDILNQNQSYFDKAIAEMTKLIQAMYPPETDFGTMTDQELNDLLSRSEKMYGPEFTAIKQRAEQDFGTAQRFAQENLQKLFGQTDEDVSTSRTRIARNYSEAMNDTQMALAGRGLTFGGSRIKAERSLTTERDENLSDLAKTAGRTLGTADRGFQREFGSANLPGLPSLDFYGNPNYGEAGIKQTGLTQNLEDIARDRRRAIGGEYLTEVADYSNLTKKKIPTGYRDLYANIT